MRHLIATVAFLVMAAAGCHSQVPAAPYYSCPSSAVAGNYTSLNQTNPTSALTYTDSTAPATGQFCYIAQSLYQGGVSAPSNTAGPYAVPSGNTVDLTWKAPSDPNAASYTYVLSRAAAVSTTLGSPSTLGGETQAALAPPIENPAPQAQPAKQTALNAPSGLRIGQ